MLVSQSSLRSCITLAYLLATHCHICLLCTCKPTPTDAYYFGFNILRSAQVKSYLAGNPPIKIKLNDDLLITLAYTLCLLTSHYYVCVRPCACHFLHAQVKSYLASNPPPPHQDQAQQ
jgi:hypothetical protein